MINCQLLHQARSLWCTAWEFITTRTSHDGRTPPPAMAAETIICRRVSSYLCPCVAPRVSRRCGRRFSTWKACVTWWASRKFKEWWSVGTRFRSKHWSKHGVWTRMLPCGPIKPRRLPGMSITKMNFPSSTRRKNRITIATNWHSSRVERTLQSRTSRVCRCQIAASEVVQVVIFWGGASRDCKGRTMVMPCKSSCFKVERVRIAKAEHLPRRASRHVLRWSKARIAKAEQLPSHASRHVLRWSK